MSKDISSEKIKSALIEAAQSFGNDPITKNTIWESYIIPNGLLDRLVPAIEQLLQDARIEALQWALNDYNMPDTDTKENLEGYIAQLKAELKGEDK